jgi:hypothetical protein
VRDVHSAAKQRIWLPTVILDVLEWRAGQGSGASTLPASVCSNLGLLSPPPSQDDRQAEKCLMYERLALTLADG